MSTFVKQALSLLVQPTKDDSQDSEQFWGIGLGEGDDIHSVGEIIDILEDNWIELQCPYDTEKDDVDEDSTQIIIRYDIDGIYVYYTAVVDNDLVSTKKKTTISVVKDILESMEDEYIPFYDVAFNKTYP